MPSTVSRRICFADATNHVRTRPSFVHLCGAYCAIIENDKNCLFKALLVFLKILMAIVSALRIKCDSQIRALESRLESRNDFIPRVSFFSLKKEKETRV